jgi:hypothetical protein
VEEGKMEEMDGKEGVEEIDGSGFFFFFIGLLVLSKGLAISHPLIFLERSEP